MQLRDRGLNSPLFVRVFIATPTVAFPPQEFHSPRTTAELPVLLTENDNCQAARMIIRTGAFGGVR
jgi:hypothetical protein